MIQRIASLLYMVVISVKVFIFKLEVLYFLLVICFRVNVSICDLSNYFFVYASKNLMKISILSKNVTFHKCLSPKKQNKQGTDDSFVDMDSQFLQVKKGIGG